VQNFTVPETSTRGESNHLDCESVACTRKLSLSNYRCQQYSIAELLSFSTICLRVDVVDWPEKAEKGLFNCFFCNATQAEVTDGRRQSLFSGPVALGWLQSHTVHRLKTWLR
jgi:hypothetical protein